VRESAVSTLVVVSFECEPEAAAAVVRAANTHPYTAKAVYDEQLGRVHAVLDLMHMHAFADRQREREQVEAWLRECRDADPPREIAWADWQAAKGANS